MLGSRTVTSRPLLVLLLLDPPKISGHDWHADLDAVSEDSQRQLLALVVLAQVQGVRRLARVHPGSPRLVVLLTGHVELSFDLA